jgi:hypothetical protein
LLTDKIDDEAGLGNPILAMFGERFAGLAQPTVFIGSDLRYEKQNVYPMMPQKRETA